MSLYKMSTCACDILVVLAMCLAMFAHAEVFQGRHVCTQHHHISQTVPVRQSYRRAVYNKELQRVTYQTAYRMVFRLQIRPEAVAGCCPGWKKRSARDTNCLQPVCNEECENGGQCISPGLCMCSEGYTGYKCHIDIDECSGRHTCQQKCTNLPGSYECSCQEGFTLAEDESTCNLCLSCTPEFQNMQAELESAKNKNRHDEMFDEIRLQMETLNEVKKKTDKFQDIERRLDNLSDITVHDERFDEIQNEITSLKELKSEMNKFEEIDRKIQTLEEKTKTTDKIQEMESEIDNLKEMTSQMDTIKELKDKVRELQEDDTQAQKLQELQKQIDSLREVKAQADGVQEMQKEIGKLKEMTTKMDSMQDMKNQMQEMARRIQELEEDKAILKNNLTTAVTKYEEAISALHQKEVTTQEVMMSTTTRDPYAMNPEMPLDRLASLSEQISILEEKISSCMCDQMYYRG